MSEPRASDQFLAAVVSDEARLVEDEQHPSADELLEYAERKLTPSLDGRLQDHLAGCRMCTQRLLDLAAFNREASLPSKDVPSLAVAAAWRDFKPRISEDSESRPYWQRRVAYGVAATLVFAVLGLSTWIVELRDTQTILEHTLASQSSLRPNLPVFYVDSQARSAANSADIEAPIDSNFVVLIITPMGLDPLAHYEVRFFDSASQELFQVEDLVPDEEGGLRIGVPTHLLPAGEYTIRLNGYNNREEPQLVEEYVRQIRYR